VKTSLKRLEEEEWWLYGHCVYALLFQCSEKEQELTIIYLIVLNKGERAKSIFYVRWKLAVLCCDHGKRQRVKN